MMRPEHAGVRRAYASLDEMLSPLALSEILGRPIESVRREPFVIGGWSSTDASFQGVHVDGEVHPSLIAKLVAREKDWVAIATDDQVDREVWTWECGLLDRLGRPAAHAVLAGARTDDASAILMPNLADHLLPDDDSTAHAPALHDIVVNALATLHAAFWMDEQLYDARDGLSTLARQTSLLAPSTMERVRARMGALPVADWIDEGWGKLPDVVDRHLAADLLAIAEDPRPVVDAAARQPWTLVHADPRPANLAVDMRSRTVFLLDWARPAPAPPAIDLLYWMFTSNSHLSVRSGRLIGAYATALQARLGARFANDWWDDQLALSFGAFVACFAPIIAHSPQGVIQWWADRARPALSALA